MSFARYLRLEGACSAVLGAALVAVAAIWGAWERPWLALVVAAAGSALAVWGARRVTAATVRDAGDGAPEMPETAVRRQTILETAAWILAVGVWVALTGSSAELIAGTGVASAAFGAARARAAVPPGLLVSRRHWVLGARATAPRTVPGR